jgi:hypothetical protein
MAKVKKPKLDPHVAALCKATYIEELDKANGYLDIGGVPVQERCIRVFINDRKCTRAEGEAYFDEATLFYLPYVNRVLKMLEKRGDPIAKKLPEKYTLDPDYVYQLAIECYEDRIGGRQKYIKQHMAKNKSTRERAEKRFEEYSQGYAPVLRSVLKALIQFNQIPKKAIKARK